MGLLCGGSGVQTSAGAMFVYLELFGNLTSSDWLKADFWIPGPVAADILYNERLLFVGLPLCDVHISAANEPCKSQNQIQNFL